jgi:predicted membrane-bound mannosyltransferase
MIAYWGKQQKDPRLPGRHDYYIVLMLLYELPIVLVGLCGLVHASRHRTPFTDLLLWWAFTSFTLYALANEKVPWLMTHIMLPWALLGGVWLAQQIRLEASKRLALTTACVLGAIYLGRGAIATNFERPVDKHEPLFYAQTSETYRDALFDAMRKTQNNNGLIWMHNDLQWPTVWYTRAGAPLLNESPVTFTADPGSELLRVAISNKDVWEKNERFRRWTSVETNFYIWPRASWPALRPPVWAKFWWTRRASTENGVLASPGESPGAALAIIGTPPCANEPCY